MAGLLVALISGVARGRWLVPIIAVLFVASVSAVVVGLVRRRDDARDRHQVDCSLRVVEGAVDGLTSRWRSGAAVIEQGEIRFRRMVGGVRFLPGRRVDLKGARVGLRLGPTTWAEVRSVALGSEVVQLTTADAVIEAAFPPRVMQWVVQQLNG
ncbi:hypothetical protein GCM10022197_04010 [Microlunatus spumicola]|uniref:PH domain-containing protein n=1 Tax=Microlunatus spumicola TaxID=81499 RepID=A0ABP6WJJ5_9ACTN